MDEALLSEKQRERRKKFKGDQSHFFFGDVVGPPVEAVDPSGFKDVRFRPPLSLQKLYEAYSGPANPYDAFHVELLKKMIAERAKRTKSAGTALGSPDRQACRSSTRACPPSGRWRCRGTWPTAAAPARPAAWSASRRTRWSATGAGPALLRTSSTTSWWLFPPRTTRVQLDEKWSFVGRADVALLGDGLGHYFAGGHLSSKGRRRGPSRRAGVAEGAWQTVEVRAGQRGPVEEVRTGVGLPVRLVGVSQHFQKPAH
jgi:hypothetical protein